MQNDNDIIFIVNEKEFNFNKKNFIHLQVYYIFCKLLIKEKKYIIIKIDKAIMDWLVKDLSFSKCEYYIYEPYQNLALKSVNIPLNFVTLRKLFTIMQEKNLKTYDGVLKHLINMKE